MNVGMLSLLSFVFLLLVPSSGSTQETIRFLTYHNLPPFVIEQNKRLGATYELAKHLTEKSNGQYKFETETLSRLALDRELATSCRCVVPWVNPVWFRDRNLKKFNWTSGYAQGRNAIVSLASKPVEYSGPSSLVAQSISGVAGSVYIGLESYIKKGKIRKVETNSMLSSLKDVQAGTADVTLIPASAARYLIASNNLGGVFHFSTEPHSTFSRYFLIANFQAQEDKNLRDYLQSQIPYLKDNPEWKARIAKYGL
ncbi:MAG: transporter substrate-binding domain-containing protein [Sneathiella sp.]